MSEPRGERDRVMTVLAVLMGLMAFSNFMKPVVQARSDETIAGFVLFGTRLHGVANAIVGPLFGVLLAVYAYGVWTRKAWVLPIAIGYAAYVVANVVLFTLLAPPEQYPGLLQMLAYGIVAVGVSSGGAYHLWRNRARLRAQ